MKRGLLHLLLVTILGCIALAAGAEPVSPVLIASEAEHIPIWEGLRVIAPADRQLAPQQAADLAAGTGAMSVDSPARVFGRGTSPYWALFSLVNPEASVQRRMLALEATTQFDTRLYQRNDKGDWLRIQSLSDAAAWRVGDGTNYPVWMLHLGPQRTTELLLRVEGPAVVRFPLFIYQPVRLTEDLRKMYLALGIALGICLIIGAYVVSLRRYLDDKSVPLFICMIVADMVGALWLTGYLKAFFPGLPESTLSPIGFAAYALLFGCGSLHARISLNSGVWLPKSDRFLQGLVWFWLALASWFSVVFPVAARILTVWGGTSTALILVVVSILAARKRVPFSGFIAAAWLVYLLVGMHFLLARVTDNPLLWSSSTITLIQATVIAILFGSAMVQRLMRQRDVLIAGRQEAVTLREQGAALMRERSLLFAATNHDLRQPLVGVSLLAYLLKSAATAEERAEISQKLDIALKEVDDLLVSIQQLAAVHEAAHNPVFESVKIDELLLPVIEEYRGRSECKRITIRYVSSRLSITTHVPYFKRIVRNALSNAIRYTAGGDRILVGCRRGGGLSLLIADTGRGMTEAQTALAFEAFQRFDTEMTIPDGIGLGLFSTRSLAHALGLEVSLHSREGRGTEFRIHLHPQHDSPTQRY